MKVRPVEGTKKKTSLSDSTKSTNRSWSQQLLHKHEELTTQSIVQTGIAPDSRLIDLGVTKHIVIGDVVIEIYWKQVDSQQRRTSRLRIIIPQGE